MRGKGEGSIYQRANGLWCAVVELPSQTKDRRRRTITSKDKRVVVTKLRKLQAELSKTGDLPTSSQTVEQWMTYWLREIVAKEVRPKTAANYRSFVNKHIIPAMGKTNLEKVTPAQVRALGAHLTTELSSTSAATAHRIMSSAFTSAEREGRMGRNPAKLASAPRIATHELEVLTLEEVQRLLGLFDDGTEKTLWTTFMLTGARRGEILGLEWERIDFGDKTNPGSIDLSWQLQRHPVEMVAPADYEYRRLDGGLYLTRPKSKAGWRVVPLVPPLLGYLAAWKERAATNPHGLVFATAEGKPIDPDFASKQWPKVLAAAGLTKQLRLHDIRHTTVDLLLDAGVDPNIVKEIIGHSTVAMTRAYQSRASRLQLTEGMNQLSATLGIES